MEFFRDGCRIPRSRAREAVSFGPVLPDAAFRMTSIRCIVVPLSNIHEAITRVD